MNYSVGNDPGALVSGDLNGDGKPDLVAVNTTLSAKGTGSSSVSVLLQDPAHPGQFLSAVNYPTGFAPVDVAIGDLNGDGRPDLAVADTTGISTLLQSSTAPGQFLPLTTIAVGSGGTAGIAIVDLNADGKTDIVATSSELMVFMQDSATPGRVLAPVHYTVGAQPYAVAVQDLNSDGRPDIAVANLGSPDGTVAASLSVVLQNPASPGNFLPATSCATGIRSWTITAADLNGDGKPIWWWATWDHLLEAASPYFCRNPMPEAHFNLRLITTTEVLSAGLAPETWMVTAGKTWCLERCRNSLSGYGQSRKFLTGDNDCLTVEKRESFTFSPLLPSSFATLLPASPAGSAFRR